MFATQKLVTGNECAAVEASWNKKHGTHARKPNDLNVYVWLCYEKMNIPRCKQKCVASLLGGFQFTQHHQCWAFNSSALTFSTVVVAACLQEFWVVSEGLVASYCFSPCIWVTLFSLRLKPYILYAFQGHCNMHSFFSMLHHLSCINICMHVRVYCTWYSPQFVARHESHHVKPGKLNKKVQFPVSMP